MLKLRFLSWACVSSLINYLSRRCDSFPAWLHDIPVLQTSCFPTVGSWLIPGTGTLCPPASPHPQFGAPLSLSPAHSCERYSSLRNHRPAPYPNPYTHRNNSPSKSDVAALSKWAKGREVLSGGHLERCHRSWGRLFSSVCVEGLGPAWQRNGGDEYVSPVSLWGKNRGGVELSPANRLDCIVLAILCFWILVTSELKLTLTLFFLSVKVRTSIISYR